MAKPARLPLGDGATSMSREDVLHAPRLRTRYYAFLSYSHQDKQLADWLHRELEKFRVPTALAGKLTAHGVVPRRLTPIFRDQHDLSAGGDLAVEIKAALAASQFLVVLCSPTAARSRWTNAEIESFKRTRPEGCVLAAVASGEPFASDIPGREDEECFPPALRYKYDRRGHQTAKRADPLAADFRDGAEGPRMAFLKLVAGMLGVGLDELVQRETTRRHRQMAWLAAASLAGMAVTSTLAVTAIQSRNEAREQRREAEGLIGYMLGDLKDKLEPIGKLDALDGVGGRVLAYYHNQPIADLSDAALTQRSQALSLMASVATQRGKIDNALGLYREAMVGTAEAMRRSPNNPQPIFDHAQNVFYVGEIAHERNNFAAAEANMREYQRLALQMVALQPDSMKYRMEKVYADFNLGVVLSDERQFQEAVAQFDESLRTMEAIATADPGNTDYQENLAESLTWLSDAQYALGDYRSAIAARERDIAIIERLFSKTRDVDFERRLIASHRSLGVYYREQGRSEAAMNQFRTAVSIAEALIPKEPTNAVWLEQGYRSKFALGDQLLLSGNTGEAAAQTQGACQIVNSLLNRDRGNPEWRAGASKCWAQQARIALASGSKDQALKFAQAAVEASKAVPGKDVAANAYAAAGAYRLVGDIQRDLGNANGAKAAWEAAFARLPRERFEEPSHMAERATILARLGRTGEAQLLQTRLQKIGYRLSIGE